MTVNNQKKDYIWNTVGVFLQSAISPVLLVVVTRINGIYDSGVFSFASSISIIFLIIGLWGGRTYQVSDAHNQNSLPAYIVVRLYTSIIVLGLAIVFCVLNQYDLPKSSIIIGFVLIRVFESIADVFYGILQSKNRLYQAGLSLTIKSVVGFVGFVAVDVVTHNILYSVAAVAAINLAVLVLYDIPRARQVAVISLQVTTWQRIGREAWQIMRATWRLPAVTLLTTLSLNIQRYFIDVYYPDQTGFFGIIAMPITLLLLFMTFILQPRVVEITTLYTEKKYVQLRRLVGGIFLISGGLGLVALTATALVGVPLLNLVFGVSFDEYYAALLLIMIGGVLNAFVAIFINLLTIFRRLNGQFWVLLVTNVLLVAITWLSVRQYGLIGGVWSFAAVCFIQAAALRWLYTKIVIKS